MRLWKPSRRGRCSRTRAPRTSPPLCLKTSWHWASSLKPRSESSFTWRDSQEKNVGNCVLGTILCVSTDAIRAALLRSTHFWSRYFYFFHSLARLLPQMASIRSNHFHFFWFNPLRLLLSLVECLVALQFFSAVLPKYIFSVSGWYTCLSASNVRKVCTSPQGCGMHLFTAIKTTNKQKKEDSHNKHLSCLTMMNRGSCCSVCSVFGSCWWCNVSMLPFTLPFTRLLFFRNPEEGGTKNAAPGARYQVLFVSGNKMTFPMLAQYTLFKRVCSKWLLTY